MIRGGIRRFETPPGFSSLKHEQVFWEKENAVLKMIHLFVRACTGKTEMQGPKLGIAA